MEQTITTPVSLPRIGDKAPAFKAVTTQGEIDFPRQYEGSWVILFSHPADFTPVCTTELGAVSRLKPEFDRRGVKVLGLSIDSLESHKVWVQDIEDTQGVALNFPLLADADRMVAELYGMIHPNSDNVFTARSVYIIDPAKKLRLTITYPAPTGRNFNEILRVVDALQLTDRQKVATPVDWKQGDDVIILPSVSDEAAKELFPGGWKALKSYLRITPQPK